MTSQAIHAESGVDPGERDLVWSGPDRSCLRVGGAAVSHDAPGQLLQWLINVLSDVTTVAAQAAGSDPLGLTRATSRSGWTGPVLRGPPSRSGNRLLIHDLVKCRHLVAEPISAPTSQTRQ